MAASATTQMNVRIDRELREAGDRVFSSLGISATDAVRATWRFAIRHADKPKEVVAFVRANNDDAEESQRASRLQAAQRGAHICDSLGHLSASTLSLSDDELKSLAYAERYGKDCLR